MTSRTPYLELVRLVREASEIEHALLVQYLYASFSVKSRYQAVIGTGGDSISLVGVAVQEMHHLARVNELLTDLHAALNLVRQEFPYEPDIYPFELSMEPLSRLPGAPSSTDRSQPCPYDWTPFWTLGIRRATNSWKTSKGTSSKGTGETSPAIFCSR
jgi:Ferritin-like